MPRAARQALLGLTLLALLAGFVSLGVWQLDRRVWKLALIERVEQGLQAAPVSAPARADWPRIDRDQAYRRLRIEGRWLDGHEALVQAVTERGAGWWLLAPLQREDGSLVWINRGFVDEAHRHPEQRAAGDGPGTVTLTGLLRLSEPGGAFLRQNDPSAQRWYSRDVLALSAAAGLPLADTAPYFIDADAASSPGWPLGGLTIVRFHNSHLVYALTWFGMALLVIVAAAILVRHERRRLD